MARLEKPSAEPAACTHRAGGFFGRQCGCDHPQPSLSLGRRILRLVAVGVGMMAVTSILQTLVLYWTMPSAAKRAENRAEAACRNFAVWLEPEPTEGRSGSNAESTLEGAVEAADAAARLAPKRWGELAEGLNGVAGSAMTAAAPTAGPVPDDAPTAISRTVSLCDPLVSQDLGQIAAKGRRG